MQKLLLGILSGILLVASSAPTVADSQQSLDPFVVAPQHFHLDFENQYVRVIRERTAPHEKVPMHEHSLGGVMVLLMDQNIRQTLPDGSTREIHRKAGETYWGDPQTHAGENLSDKPFEYVRVDIKAATGRINLSAPAASVRRSLDPTVVDPVHFKVEFENEYVRVIRIKPERGHQATHAHPAPGAIVVALTNAELRLRLSDGSAREVSYKAGDARWSATTDPHQDEVISDQPVELIRIEPKLRN
jgi:hypothetical protein